LPKNFPAFAQKSPDIRCSGFDEIIHFVNESKSYLVSQHGTAQLTESKTKSGHERDRMSTLLRDATTKKNVALALLLLFVYVPYALGMLKPAPQPPNQTPICGKAVQRVSARVRYALSAAEECRGRCSQEVMDLLDRLRVDLEAVLDGTNKLSSQ